MKPIKEKMLKLMKKSGGCSYCAKQRDYTAEAKLKQIKQLVEDWELTLNWKFVALIKNILKE